MYCVEPQIDREYILSRLSEVAIMERYTGINVQYRRKVHSPLRKDNVPTCRFCERSGRLYLTDFSGAFKGDCFKVVMHQYGDSFYEALRRIAADFNLVGGNVPLRERTISMALTETKTVAAIDIKIRAWNEVDKTYWWDRFHLSQKLLKRFNVYAVAVAWLNGDITYSYRADDPCYAYRFDTGDYKLYFPMRGKDKLRFMGNSRKLQGYRQLPARGELLIITKALKDVMVLASMGVNAVAYQAESVKPDPVSIAVLQSRFTGIYTLYDFDLAGIRTANWIKRQYGITPLMMTNGRFHSPDYRAKDVAEWVTRFGYQPVRDKVQECVDNHFAHRPLRVAPIQYAPGSLMDVSF